MKKNRTAAPMSNNPRRGMDRGAARVLWEALRGGSSPLGLFVPEITLHELQRAELIKHSKNYEGLF